MPFQALVRKIDWHVMLWAGVMFASLNMDRSNLTQANTDNFLGDLGLTTDGAYTMRVTVWHSLTVALLFVNIQ